MSLDSPVQGYLLLPKEDLISSVKPVVMSLCKGEGMDQRALDVLHRYFGYTSFRPAQEAPVTALLSGRDTVAIMPTGAGKSICFQVPALIHLGLTVVFSPLISLMKDQVDGLQQQKVPAVFINSTLTQDDFNKTMYYVRTGHVKLLYISPERLGSQYFCNVLRALPISQVIVDEAHCISQWGHDFRPAYQLIGPFLATLPHRPVVGAFTATATEAVEEDIKKLLGLEGADVFITGFDRPNLSFSVVRGVLRMDYVLDYVEQHRDESGVIYCITRKDVEKVYENLIQAGIHAGYYHAGLSDQVRKDMQNKYAYDEVQVMVATNAFGMGIDKSNVRYVLHYQMPRNMESYYQEAGRAGRDGAPAECILLYSGQDTQVHKYLIEQSHLELARQSIEEQKLQAMVDYCFSSHCLRKYMMSYFGEEVPWTHCDNCSACKNKDQLVDLTVEAKAIFRAILVTDERFGATMIASIVRGERTDRIVRGGYDALTMFGALSQYSAQEVKGFIQQFVAAGYIHSSMGKYPILSITAGGEEVLDGYKRVEEMKQNVVTPRRRSTLSAGARSRSAARTNGQKPGLFEHLRQHRKRLAAEQKIPPYLIFPDTVLIDLAASKPKTLAEFHAVKGVGEAKLKNYGTSFLQAIAEYESKNRG